MNQILFFKIVKMIKIYIILLGLDDDDEAEPKPPAIR